MRSSFLACVTIIVCASANAREPCRSLGDYSAVATKEIKLEKPAEGQLVSFSANDDFLILAPRSTTLEMIDKLQARKRNIEEFEYIELWLNTQPEGVEIDLNRYKYFIEYSRIIFMELANSAKVSVLDRSTDQYLLEAHLDKYLCSDRSGRNLRTNANRTILWTLEWIF